MKVYLKLTIFFLINCIFLCVCKLSAAERQSIQFKRLPILNKFQNYSMDIFSKTTSITDFATISKPDAVSTLTTKINTNGLLKVTKINNLGLATNLQFQIKSFDTKINGKNIKTNLPGKELFVNLNHKPLCEFSLNSNKSNLHPDEIQILSLIFKPTPEFTLADYIGTDKLVKIGDSWSPEIKPFIKFFKKLGLDINKSQISGKVLLKSKQKINNIECWELNEEIKLIDVPNVEFAFILSVFLPVNPNDGESVKFIKKSHLMLIKTPKGNSFMTSGINKISLELNDVISIVRNK